MPDDMPVLFSMNHALLNAIGVGHAVLDRVAVIAATSGFTGTKLTGAGGGGCALILLSQVAEPESESALLAALEAQQFRAFVTTIGGLGAQLHSGDSMWESEFGEASRA